MNFRRIRLSGTLIWPPDFSARKWGTCSARRPRADLHHPWPTRNPPNHEDPIKAMKKWRSNISIIISGILRHLKIKKKVAWLLWLVWQVLPFLFFFCKKCSVNVKLPLCEVCLSALADEKCCWTEPAMQTDKFQRTYWKWLQLSQTAKLNTGWAAGYLVDGQRLWHGAERHMALKTTFGTRHLSTEIDPKQRRTLIMNFWNNEPKEYLWSTNSIFWTSNIFHTAKVSRIIKCNWNLSESKC